MRRLLFATCVRSASRRTVTRTHESETTLWEIVESLAPIQGIGLVADEAVFHGLIADVLEARGELDEALRIRREEQLPVYERLGDVRGVVLTQMKVADIQEKTESVKAAVAAYLDIEFQVEKLGDAWVQMWFHRDL
ncbi:MAG: hypothetical protein R3C49_16860 [Planctomycetaceae bacterium]